MEVNGQLHAPAALSPTKQPQVSNEHGVCRPQSRLDCFAYETNLLAPPGVEPRFLSRPACSFVTIVTELSQFLFFFSIHHRLRCLKWYSLCLCLSSRCTVRISDATQTMMNMVLRVFPQYLQRIRPFCCLQIIILTATNSMVK
jgi:hypothetical protein